jgi:tetratricopeptide (TPR) repeat protein
MRLGMFFLSTVLAFAQGPDPLSQAYTALQARRYDEAISLFRKALESSPGRAATHQDLAYTYLKVGEREEAREQFREAARLDPANEQAALECAFLSYETHQEAEARRLFDRLRKSPNPATRSTAEPAFRNIDEPLAAGIRRWTEAIARGDHSFTTHYELAKLAEQRDELALAAEHYEKAWRAAPEHRNVLVDLGRAWKAMGRADDSMAALLTASRSGETRAAESARELLPARYPYVYEFRNALRLDPRNIGLRREFGYLLLKMNREKDAEEQFRLVVAADPDDLLSVAQLGFLLLARKNTDAAMPLLERVLQGGDTELANRVRAVLRMPQVQAKGEDARQMAERSIKAGYLKDALRYLDIAHEADPLDFSVMLKLGWTYNMLHDDVSAARWFDLARKSPDPAIASEADHAWHNLWRDLEPVRVTAWAFPTWSSRWRDMFSYSQVKVEWHAPGPFHPYLSMRLIADTRSQGDPANPLLYSESAVILAAGVASRPWHAMTLWGEAGESVGYLSHHVMPDYRGGLAFARGWQHRAWFFETNADAVFLSRFQDDALLYAQNRAGYTIGRGSSKLQLYWNGNFTTDQKRQYWANFAETGPGVRFRSSVLPNLPVVSLNFVRGAYTVNQSNPRRPNFYDVRIGLWYALTH